MYHWRLRQPSRLRSVNTDGEIATETPAHFKIIPQAISVFAPMQTPVEDERDTQKADAL